MLKVGDQTEISIHTVAFGGDGIGRNDDLVVFVPFTAEGDVCMVAIDAVKKNYLKGHVERLLTASPLRTEPLCPYYTRCGGCQYQHMGYEHQLAVKQRQLLETFERIGKMNAPCIRDIIPSPKIYHYRGKADFQVHFSKGMLPVLGFIDTSGSTVIPVESCALLDESINQAIAVFQKNVAAHKIQLTSDRQTIWSDPASDGVSVGLNPGRLPRYIERFAKGKHFQIPYNGFFQINTSLLDTLVDTVTEMCSLTGNESVLDAYCGSGLFSIFLAPKAKQVYGIDNDGPAIHCAKINSGREGLDHLTFYRGDASFLMKSGFVQALRHIACVILDPPRSGCEPDVLDAVIALKPEKVIYISCNPATQARDVRYLIDRGVSLKYIQPLDMFPQTRHIEAVALLTF